MPGDAVTIAFYVGAIGVTAYAGFQIYRQPLKSYEIVKDFLVGVYALILILMLIELWRVAGGTRLGMEVYAPFSIGIGLTEAILLSAAAVGLYMRPVGSSLSTFLSDLRKNRVQAGLFAVFSIFSVSIIAYVAAFMPYSIEEVTALGGGQVLALVFPQEYVLLLCVVLFFFLCYPTVALFLATQNIPNKSFGGSLLSLPVGWAGVTIIYVVFEGFLWIEGLDATGLMYFLDAVLFFMVTRNFRKAALLAGLVVPVGFQGKGQDLSGKKIAGLEVEGFGGRPILLEAQPSSGFEEQVAGIVSILLSAGKSVFVFTSRGSRVQQAISAVQGVRLYLLTPTVSYYKQGERENEMLLSSANSSIVLDALGKSIGNSDQQVGIVFDSLSDLVLSLGFAETYKFLRSAFELCADRRVVSFFVLLSGSQDKNVENALTGRFPIIMANDKDGMRTIKASVSLPSKS